MTKDPFVPLRTTAVSCKTNFHKDPTSIYLRYEILFAAPKLRAHIHVLCVITCMCRPTNNINQFREAVIDLHWQFCQVLASLAGLPWGWIIFFLSRKLGHFIFIQFKNLCSAWFIVLRIKVKNTTDLLTLLCWGAPIVEGRLVVLVRDDLGERVHVGVVWRTRTVSICDDLSCPSWGCFFKVFGHQLQKVALDYRYQV